MEEIVKKYLMKLDEDSDLNFAGLAKLIEANEIPIKNTRFTVPAPGMCANDCVYLDIPGIESVNSYTYKFFVVAHEISHFLRFKRKGENYNKDSYKENDFNKFGEFVIFEEMFADRFARYIYNSLNESRFPDFIVRSTGEYVKAISFIEPMYRKINSGEVTYEEYLDELLEDNTEKLEELEL